MPTQQAPEGHKLSVSSPGLGGQSGEGGNSSGGGGGGGAVHGDRDRPVWQGGEEARLMPAGLIPPPRHGAFSNLSLILVWVHFTLSHPTGYALPPAWGPSPFYCSVARRVAWRCQIPSMTLVSFIFLSLFFRSFLH